MSNMYGMFVGMNEDGQTVTSRIKMYDSYEQMVADSNPGFYGIVDNVVYHRNGTNWVVGFPNVVKEDDYTAFEIAAHDEDIPVGYSEFLGGYVSQLIPASKTHILRLRSTLQPSDFEVDSDTGVVSTEVWKKSDVIIDWGDGTTTTAKSGNHSKFDVSPEDLETSAEYTHTYANQGKYIIKVYGRDYFNIGIIADPTGLSANEKIDYINRHNLICRVMDTDLPIASHVTSLARFAQRSIRMLKVQLPSYYKLPAFENGSGMFGMSVNLQYIKGFKNRLLEAAVLDDCCNGCVNLLESDLMIPSILSRGSAKAFYAACAKLTTPIDTLFHGCGILNGKISFRTAFKGCVSTTTDFTKLAKILWENPNVEFTDTFQAFYGLPTEQAAQVPVSWGGTKAE